MTKKEQPYRRLTEKERLELKLNLRIASLEITVDEAEEEYQHYMHKGNDSYLGVYGW